MLSTFRTPIILRMMLTKPRKASDTRHFFWRNWFCRFSLDITSAANSEMSVFAFSLVMAGSRLTEAKSACSSRYAACCSFDSCVISCLAIWMTRSTAECVPSCSSTSCVKPPLRLMSICALVACPSSSLPDWSTSLSCSFTLVLSSITCRAAATARFNGSAFLSSTIDSNAPLTLFFSSMETWRGVRSALSISEPRASRAFSASTPSAISRAAFWKAVCIALVGFARRAARSFISAIRASRSCF